MATRRCLIFHFLGYSSKHSDQYSRTKTKAELLVLQNNGRIVADNEKSILCTSVIRPAAIYGEEEQRHFPRIVQHIDNDILKFRIGSRSIVDWVHIDNLVHAYLLLIKKAALLVFCK